jgi:carbon-monoxide dehydrogenase small subunit
MLISARDIVTRLPQADEARIRLELSGNLCRCTGYMGIVAAIKDVLTARKASGAPAPQAGDGLGPVGAHPPTAAVDERPQRARPSGRPAAAGAAPALTAEHWAAVEAQGVELRQTFAVPYPPEEVWRFFGDLERVARCMPGARLTSVPRDGRAEGEINVKLGPIVSAFAGQVEVERYAGSLRGVARGAGRDTRSASNARALVVYTVAPQDDGSSRVDVSLKLLLSGALAQFSRSGLLKDVADHLTRLFAKNLAAAMSGAPLEEDRRVLDAGAVARAALLTRITALLRRLFRR